MLLKITTVYIFITKSKVNNWENFIRVYKITLLKKGQSLS